MYPKSPLKEFTRPDQGTHLTDLVSRPLECAADTDLGMAQDATSESCTVDDQTLPITTCGFYIVIKSSREFVKRLGDY